MSIEKALFGTYGGKDVDAYTLRNKRGASLTILTYGGIMNRLYLPDRNGELADVICGFDTVEDYIADRGSYTGALIGRYGNRIAGGGFSLNGRFYAVASNETGRGHLHGGNIGFNRRLWDAEAVEGDTEDRLILTLFSPDGEEGYPGNLFVKVTYIFDDLNVLTIHYEAHSDQDTVLNMTSHTYYNLNGSTRFKGGVPQCPLHAMCLETQYSPDTPNRPYMPSCTLLAGEKYDTVTRFAFGIR